ncbi:hypothetical protein Ahy_A02g007428 [Arachis hypogaea]|uniref:Transposase Tnp1/En/Spm-like domain-containing protein n=1 Tax=Arachis hypogaea TaxID=3818 RepID=A0A445EC80_ARAHY|nr:hypothetical protein Ahy_A02g007428 [Arachis hypogaea]
MARKGRYTKKPKSGPGSQQPQTTPPSASRSHQADSQVLPAGGDGIPPTSRPFRPPRNEPRPSTQMSAIVFTTWSYVRRPFWRNLMIIKLTTTLVLLDLRVAKDARLHSFGQLRSSILTAVKPTRLSVREAMERPNGRRIPIGDKAGLLSGVLGLLGSDYGKFSIGKESWHKVTTKDKVYNECVKIKIYIPFQIFHFDEDSKGSIKKYIWKSMGRSWKETRLGLYNAFYEPTFTFEQNIEHHPPEIDREHWKKFLEYRAKPETKEKCKKNATNRSKQLYTHTGDSKSFAWRMEEESKEGESVEESYGSQCKKNDGSYMNDEARAIGVKRIEEIEQQDESSRVLSQNDSIAQVFGKEKSGRVRGVGFGLTPTQLFGLNSHAPGNRVEVEEIQRKLFALQAELEGEKLKRKAMEDEAAADKKKMQAMKRALIYLFQRQGEELPQDITVRMSSME